MFNTYSNNISAKNEKMEQNIKAKSSPECKNTNSVANNAEPPTRGKGVNKLVFKESVSHLVNYLNKLS